MIHKHNLFWPGDDDDGVNRPKLTTSETIEPALLNGLGKRSSLGSAAATAAPPSSASALLREHTLLSRKSRWRTAGEGLPDLPLAENSLLGSSERRRERKPRSERKEEGGVLNSEARDGRSGGRLFQDCVVRTCNHEARSNEEGIKRRRTDGRTSGSHSLAGKCTLLPSLLVARASVGSIKQRERGRQRLKRRPISTVVTLSSTYILACKIRPHEGYTRCIQVCGVADMI